MTGVRGALLILEGCDRAGKSTQVKMLVQELNNRGIPAEARGFPNRTTVVGEVINQHLSKKQDLSAEVAHLLFSANRWESQSDILKALKAGITLVIDRYAASGAAYTAAVTNRSLSWCKQPDTGLPKPDAQLFLKISEESQSARSGWGKERFESSALQKKVALNYELLMDDTWTTIDANQDAEEVHKKILEISLDVIKRVKHSPVGLLYEL